MRSVVRNNWYDGGCYFVSRALDWFGFLCLEIMEEEILVLSQCKETDYMKPFPMYF